MTLGEGGSCPIKAPAGQVNELNGGFVRRRMMQPWGEDLRQGGNGVGGLRRGASVGPRNSWAL
jgi:hypothetical protein